MEKNVFMCGSTSGFGLCLAEVFSKEFNVILNGRKNNPDFTTVIKDMNDLQIEDFQKFNPSIIVNNGFDKKNYIHSFEGSLNVVKKSMEYFTQKGEGIIININSFYGLNPDKKDPDYSAAKYGLRGYIESISEKAFNNRIRIMNIYPRAMKTGLNDGRSDFEDLIDPYEVSELILNMAKSKSFYVGSIQIDRIKI
jgi:NADP-dependent 3-hydroxy acid dehydrogenase YdfG